MFDTQPTLTSATLTLRALAMTDFDGLYRAASDPETWAGHPASDRHEKAVFEPYFSSLLASRATLAIIDNTSGDIIGCSRYYTAPDRPGTIAIGYTFLDRAYWGGATNFALKTLMHDHAFATFPEIWFHIAPSNIRSQKATAKLGARFFEDAILDLGGGPAPWQVFRLSAADWQARQRHGPK